MAKKTFTRAELERNTNNQLRNLMSHLNLTSQGLSRSQMIDKLMTYQ